MKNYYNYPKLLKISLLSFLLLTIALPASASSGLVFNINIGSYAEPIDHERLVGYNYIIEKKKNNLFSYRVGEYVDFVAAQRHRLRLKERGFDKSEVVAKLDNAFITMDEAFAILDKTSKTKVMAVNQPVAMASVKVADLNRLIDAYNKEEFAEELPIKKKTPSEVRTTAVPAVEIRSNEITFSVQIGAFSDPKAESSFEIPEKIEEQKIEDGTYRYTTGSFASYNDAVVKRMQIQDKGLEDAFVVAFKNNKRISLQEALQLR